METKLIKDRRQGTQGQLVFVLYTVQMCIRDSHNSFVGEGNHRRLWNLVYHNLEQWREDSKDGRA